MIKYIKGNLLDDNLNLSVIGAGLAKQIKNKYPEVYTEYIKSMKRKRRLQFNWSLLILNYKNV